CPCCCASLTPIRPSAPVPPPPGPRRCRAARTRSRRIFPPCRETARRSPGPGPRPACSSPPRAGSRRSPGSSPLQLFRQRPGRELQLLLGGVEVRREPNDRSTGRNQDLPGPEAALDRLAVRGTTKGGGGGLGG